MNRLLNRLFRYGQSAAMGTRAQQAVLSTIFKSRRASHLSIQASIKKIELSNRVRAKQIVDAVNRLSPVTDCKSHPLGGTATAIATGKYSRQARFECLG